MKSALSEFEYTIYPTRLCLSIVGIWPNLCDSRSFAVASNIVLLFWYTASFWFILIPQTCQLCLIGNNLDVIVNILCTVDLPVASTLIKIAIVRYYSSVVKSQLESLITDWTSPYLAEYTTIQRSGLMGRWIGLACLGAGYLTAAVNVVIRLILLKEKQTRTGVRTMFFESHFPVNISGSPWFEISWCMQALTAIYAVTAYSGIDSYFVILVLHLCGQLTVLEDQLKRLPEESSETIATRIKQIVARHNQLNTFAGTIERIFNLTFFVQMAACAIQFCLQAYQFISVSTDSTTTFPLLEQIFMIIYIAYIMFDLFIYCFVAEQLRAKSLAISRAIFHSNWYKLKPKEVHDLLIIANRAQYPLQITAGKFCTLSHDLFKVICKTSMGYLSVLLAVKERTSIA